MSVDVSIIIPTYNRLWCLPGAIESCMNTNCRTEIIVVDDKSTDGTAEWMRQAKGIVALHQEHFGKCWAVNKGLEIAKGKYIRFLDSDDRLVAGAIDEQFEIAEENGSDIVVSGYHDFEGDDHLLKTQPWVNCDDFIARQLGECDGSHYSAFLFNKAFMVDIPHRPDFAFRDDRMLILEAAIKNPKIAVHGGTALLHRVNHTDRLQASSGLKHVVQNYQHLNIYKYILGRLQQSGQLNPRRVKAATNVLWPLCHWIAKDNIDEALAVYHWILQLSPDFTIPEKGVLGILYHQLGFKATEQILSARRKFTGMFR